MDLLSICLVVAFVTAIAVITFAFHRASRAKKCYDSEKARWSDWEHRLKDDLAKAQQELTAQRSQHEARIAELSHTAEGLRKELDEVRQQAEAEEQERQRLVLANAQWTAAEASLTARLRAAQETYDTATGELNRTVEGLLKELAEVKQQSVDATRQQEVVIAELQKKADRKRDETTETAERLKPQVAPGLPETTQPEGDSAGTAPSAVAPAKIPPQPSVEKPSVQEPSLSSQVLGRSLEPPPSRTSVPIDHRRGQRTDGPEASHTGLFTAQYPRCDLVCWRSAREWRIGLELPDELSESQGLTVQQGGQTLVTEDANPVRWLLTDLVGRVEVRWIENGIQQDLSFELTGAFLFKLSKNQKLGRLVRSVSRGEYVLLAPPGWRPAEYDYEEPAANGYAAYGIYIEGDRASALQVRNTVAGTQRPIAFGKLIDGLSGNQVEDSHENYGPLFGDRLPAVRAATADAWNVIKRIVLGEEGRGKGKWPREFPAPQEPGLERSLPVECANMRGGWYFLRFYDSDDQKLESLDFRYAPELISVQIRCNAFPSENGHEPAVVIIQHKPGALVQAVAKQSGILKKEDGRTILTIPPEMDATEWKIGEGEVPLAIQLDRTWWQVASEDVPPCSWQGRDRAVALSHDDLSATSKQALWVRLPRAGWADRVSVGYEWARALTLVLRAGERHAVFPLRNLADHSETLDRAKDSPIQIWIEIREKVLSGIVAHVKADPPSLPAPPPAPAAVRPHKPVPLALPKVGNRFTIINYARDCLISSGNPDRMRRALDEMPEEAPSDCSRVRIAECLVSNGIPGRMRRRLDGILKDAPNHCRPDLIAWREHLGNMIEKVKNALERMIEKAEEAKEPSSYERLEQLARAAWHKCLDGDKDGPLLLWFVYCLVETRKMGSLNVPPPSEHGDRSCADTEEQINDWWAGRKKTL